MLKYPACVIVTAPSVLGLDLVRLAGYGVNHSLHIVIHRLHFSRMRNIRTTEVFDEWFDALRGRIAKRRIQARIDRLAMGNPGDWKPAGAPVSEMRIDHGPGYRVYYAQMGTVMVILLCGGYKSTQDADIRAAHEILLHLDLE